MSQKRIAIVMNPAARSQRAARLLEHVRNLAPKPELHITQTPGHATELAAQLAEDGADIVVAAGGDGTVNEVLQGLCKVNATRPDASTHTALGTLPAGSMNVFAWELGLRQRKNFSASWTAFQEGKLREIDLWMANDRYFLQLAGVGVDAEIVKRTTSEMKNRYGPLSYGLSAWKVLGKASPLFEIEAPGLPKQTGAQVLIGNGLHYGGPFKVFPQAAVNDGKLDLVTFSDAAIGVGHFLKLAWSVLTGSYAGRTGLEHSQVSEFTVHSVAGEPIPYEVDGEFGGATPVFFRRADFRLRVVVP
jgi:diacylglycerol kinase (ATP)